VHILNIFPILWFPSTLKWIYGRACEENHVVAFPHMKGGHPQGTKPTSINLPNLIGLTLKTHLRGDPKVTTITSF